MSHVASRAGRMWPVATLTMTAGDLLRSIAHLFESTAPAERERAAHWALLAVIVGVGGIVRFWGLTNVGLHGDEETMAMATAGILEGGLPILPSGMLYPRGLAQLYLMALSVQLFGESEWALRLPSVLCGIALIPLAYLAGRRFLRPQWCLALAGSVALLPDLIVMSQTARMYIFLLASVAGCMACLFAWERTDRRGWLVASVAVLAIGIELHPLAVTCALLFLIPGVLQGSLRKFAAGMLAAAAVILAYVGVELWLNSQYPVPPPEFAADLDSPRGELATGAQPFAAPFAVALWVAGLVVAFCVLQFVRGLRGRMVAVVTASLLLAGVVAQLLLFYHLAGLLYLCGLIVAVRTRAADGGQGLYRFVILALGAATIALVHVTLLAARPGSVVQLVGAMVGQPSVWPYVRIAEFSWIAGALAALAILWGLCRLALGRAVPDYALLALLTVWVPLFVLGLFVWNMPPRYAAASLLPMLICAFAFAQSAIDSLQRHLSGTWHRRVLPGIAAGVASVAVIDPAAAAAAIDAGYGPRPDHKGAAEFMRAQALSPADVVLAEDVLQQTYYLGSVNYWLISRKYARKFVIYEDGAYRDFYTGTAVVTNGAELDQVLQNAGGRVFVIGSGENQQDGRRDMRGSQMHWMLEESQRFEVVHVGRDGLTKVWLARPAEAGTAQAVAPPDPE